ncbi:MAG: leucine-rich repeat protein, partial [Tenericutes bacterium]|nr:leucine-rich repeat protein [Mycoplasmatota bacterium]
QWQQTFFFSLNNNQVTIMHLNIAYPYDDAIIPETLYDFPVTALDNYILSDSQVRNVFIPKTVLQISSLTFSGYMGLSSVTVDEDNPFYTSYEGALYSKDMTKLIAHPHRATGEYIIPDTVTDIDSDAFIGSYRISSIYINENLSSIKLYEITSLLSINVDPNNQTFTSVEGVLYDKSLTTLISYPVGRNYLSSIPETVHILGMESFRNSRVTSIVLPNQITEIGHAAFREVESLTNVILPDQLTELGSMAFWGSSDLIEIDIPEGVTVIRTNTFTNCSTLKSVFLPSSVVTIENYAFSYTREFEKLIFNSSVRMNFSSNILDSSSDNYYIYVHEHLLSEYTNAYSMLEGTFVQIMEINIAFMDRDNIYYEYTAMNYGDLEFASTPTHEHATFMGWYDNVEISGTPIYTVPGGLVADYILYAGWEMDQYTITFNTNEGSLVEPISQDYGSAIVQPNDPTKSGYTFEGWYTDAELTHIYYFEELVINEFTLYASWREIIAPNIDDYTFVLKDDGTYEISSFIGTDSEILIPSSYLGIAVTSIGRRAFYYSDIVRIITLPTSITSIGEYAFYNATSLKQIIIPNNVNVIDSSAFGSSGALIYTPFETIPAGWNTDGNIFESQVVWGFVEMGRNGVFEYAVLSNNTVAIMGMIESNVDFDIHIPEIIDGMEVRRILPFAFYGNSIIRYLTMPDTIEAIEQYTFSSSGIRSIYISSTASYIGVHAFSYTSLTSINIPASVTNIRYRAFYYTLSLEEITFAEGSQLTNIGENAFYYARKVTSINIPASVTSIGDGAFTYSSLLTTVTFAEDSQLISIGESAFSRATLLANINIPASVTFIGRGAFSYATSLTSIYIPESVISISDYAFISCDNLTIYVEAVSKPVGWSSSWNYSNCPVIWGYVS